MVKKFIIFFCSLVISTAGTTAHAQSIRQIESRIDKGNWEGARQLFIKAIKKDTSNVELNWIASQWFFAPHNPQRQLDSSYKFVFKAIASYRNATDRQRDRLRRQNLDEGRFWIWKGKIDSAAFEVAKQTNSVAAYDYFLNKYVTSIDVDRATELRNEVAFLEALKVNTYQSFQYYFQKYPQSHRVAEAKLRYERLLFESKTKDGKLTGFIDFVRSYPSSPYFAQAEQQVYEQSTVMGDTLSIINFVINHPRNRFRNRAINILYHLFRDVDLPLPARYESDSLKVVQTKNADYWLPLYSKGKYGFMNSDGAVEFPPTFENIDDDYRCGWTEQDVIVASEGLFARNGKKISERFSIMQPLGLGFWKVGDSTCVRALHVSGFFATAACAGEIQLVDNRFLLVRGGGAPGLHALNGRSVVKGNWDDAQWIENTLVLTRSNKKTVFTLDNILRLTEGSIIKSAHVYDDVRAVGANRILVRNGALEGIINSFGEFVVPLNRQVLILEPFGLVRKVNDDLYLDEVDKQFAGKKIKKYTTYRQWLMATSASDNMIWDLRAKKLLAMADSSWFAAGLLFMRKGDSTSIHFHSNKTLTFKNDQNVTLVSSRDSIHAFAVYEAKQKKAVFSIESGTKLFSTDFDTIESIHADLFLISRKGKKGILTKEGTVVLPIEYDIIAPNQQNYWSTFKDKKFGLVNLTNGNTLKPISDRNVGILNEKALIVFDKNKYGLVDWRGKPISAFEYEEILPWKDDLIWIKRNQVWALIDYATKKVLVDKVTRFDKWLDQSGAKMYRIQRENSFGVVHSAFGIVIPPNFSMVQNIGSNDKPLFLTDKEVEEAGIHVVIFYNSEGKFIRKEVYEEDDFEMILCDEN